MPTGTDIYMISGKRKGMGYGSVYPADLTADSSPNPDEWGPDEYWTPQAYKNWFALNKSKYGLAVAQSKMLQAIDSWGLGGIEYSYAADPAFTDYFEQNGVDVSTIIYDILHAAGYITDAAGNVIEDTADTATTITGFVSGVAPFVLLGGVLWLAAEYAAPAYDKLKHRK